MSKFLGSVTIYDTEGLEEIANEIGYSTDLHSDLKYLSADEVWSEALDYMEQEGSDSAEIRIDGLDYIVIYK